MGWGDPQGPTTGELERIDQALTAGGVPASSLDGYPISLCARVKLALGRVADATAIIEEHHADFIAIDNLLHDLTIDHAEAIRRIRAIVRCPHTPGERVLRTARVVADQAKRDELISAAAAGVALPADLTKAADG